VLPKVPPVLCLSWSGGGKMHQKQSSVVQTQIRHPNVAICKRIPIETSLPIACYKICHELAETLQRPPLSLICDATAGHSKYRLCPKLQLQHDHQHALLNAQRKNVLGKWGGIVYRHHAIRCWRLQAEEQTVPQQCFAKDRSVTPAHSA